MYEYIKGIFIGIYRDYIVIENNGIGYKVFTSGNTMSQMPKTNEIVTVYLQQIVREDFIGLYGFYSKEELSMFNTLLTINGVGAKAALSMLSIATVDSLKYAIKTGDEKTITRAPGIGKKIAQRIILELKDKIKIEDGLQGAINANVNSNIEIQNLDNYNEALAALLALGYSEKEAENALSTVDKDNAVEIIIKNCLKYLMN